MPRRFSRQELTESPGADDATVVGDDDPANQGLDRPSRHFESLVGRIIAPVLHYVLVRAGRAWVESERDSRISEILISTCWLGGGQQEMAKPYSQDLRDRVIDAVKRGK